VKAGTIENSTTNGRADEDTKADDCKTHAHTSANKTSVWRELHEDARWQGDKCSGKETEEKSEYDNTAEVVYTNKTEDENTSDKGAEEQHVQPTRFSGE